MVNMNANGNSGKLSALMFTIVLLLLGLPLVNGFSGFLGSTKLGGTKNRRPFAGSVSLSPLFAARVTLVGSGPGDPELLTIKAAGVLSDPHALVIADRLVSKEVLNLVRGEIKVANKHPGCAEKAQNEIYTWVAEGLAADRHVVRLKIGDPFVFGRGGEEVLKFREMGHEPAVIPGVSAAFSAPLLAGIPVTHRGVSNQVVMCT